MCVCVCVCVCLYKHTHKILTDNKYQTGLDTHTELLHITLQKQKAAPGLKTYTHTQSGTKQTEHKNYHRNIGWEAHRTHS